jgi:hypothetical protein
MKEGVKTPLALPFYEGEKSALPQLSSILSDHPSKPDRDRKCSYGSMVMAPSSSFKITPEERMSSLHALSKTRELLAESPDKLAILIRKLCGNLMSAITIYKPNNKVSVLDMYTSVARSVEDFSAEALKHDQTQSRALQSLKLVESKLSKKNMLVTQQQETLNSLNNELGKNQLLLENFMDQDFDQKQLKQKNDDLHRSIEELKRKFEHDIRIMNEHHVAELTHLKSSFYIVEQLKNTIEDQKSKIANLEGVVSQLKQKIMELDFEKSRIMDQNETLVNRYLMIREDLGFRMTQILTLREEMKSLKNGVMGILFNREQRENREKGAVNSIMARSLMIKDYIKQYDDTLQEEIYCYSVIRAGGYDAIPFNKLKYVVDLVAASLPGYSKSTADKFKKHESISNVFLDKTPLSKKNLSFLEHRMTSILFPHLIHHDLFEISMTEIEDLFTKNFNLLKVNEVVRAIYDSYYVELLSHERLENCPEFGSFVYLWFERFCLDTATKTVCSTKEDYAQCKKRRSEFAILITSPLFQKLWDSYIFTELLGPKYSKDDILYFLNCRHLLFLGPQQETRGVAFEIKQMVELDQAMLFLEFLLGYRYTGEKSMSESPSQIGGLPRPRVAEGSKRDKETSVLGKEEQERSNNTLFRLLLSMPRITREISRGPSLPPAKVEYIDSYHFLRILLEEYRYLKIAKFMSVADVVDAAVKKAERADSSLRYSLFSQIISGGYPDLSPVEVLTLYNRAMNLGRGTVTVDSLFIAGDTLGFFLYQERYRVLSKRLYLERVMALKRGLLYENELMFNHDQHQSHFPNDLTTLVAMVRDHKGKKVDDPLSLFDRDDMQGKPYFSVAGMVTEETMEMREKIIGWAGNLGSVTLYDNYERMLVTLTESQPSSRHFLCSNLHFLTRLTALESQITHTKYSQVYPQYTTIREEQTVLRHILNSTPPLFPSLHSLTERRDKIALFKYKQSKRIKTALLRFMDSWYKMIVELLKYKNKGKEDDSERAKLLQEKLERIAHNHQPQSRSGSNRKIPAVPKAESNQKKKSNNLLSPN